MNFNPQNISYWEYKMYFHSIDFLIVGAGIVGLSTAYHLKKNHPKARILLVDEGILPYSASSKNAGFACFGAPSELLSDLGHIPDHIVWSTVQKRWKGLQALEKWLGKTAINLELNGSWDLIQSVEQCEIIRQHLPKLNSHLNRITGVKNVFKEDKRAKNQFGFERIESTFFNSLEGQLDVSLLNIRMIYEVSKVGVQILRGIKIKNFETQLEEVMIQSNVGDFSCKNVLLCTNGFSNRLVENIDLQPARAQVLITEPIENLRVKGTFHLDEGYYYFRNIDNRLLIGGGRNANFQQENTDHLDLTDDIQNAIENVLRTIVLPTTDYKIERRWAGIMGVGEMKEPIIRRLNSRVSIAARMGGMGVAIGTITGQELAKLHS